MAFKGVQGVARRTSGQKLRGVGPRERTGRAQKGTPRLQTRQVFVTVSKTRRPNLSFASNYTPKLATSVNKKLSSVLIFAIGTFQSCYTQKHKGLTWNRSASLMLTFLTNAK